MCHVSTVYHHIHSLRTESSEIRLALYLSSTVTFVRFLGNAFTRASGASDSIHCGKRPFRIYSQLSLCKNNWTWLRQDLVSIKSQHISELGSKIRELRRHGGEYKCYLRILVKARLTEHSCAISLLARRGRTLTGDAHQMDRRATDIPNSECQRGW